MNMRGAMSPPDNTSTRALLKATRVRLGERVLAQDDSAGYQELNADG